VQAPTHARLPYPVYVALVGSQFFVGHRFSHYRTEAEAALAGALQVLRRILRTDAD
jgi:hypothetical protein